MERTRPVLKALCLDLDATIPFLRSVSYAIVAQRTTRATWVEDEGAVRYLYAAFLGAFGTPGTVQIQSASEARIREEVEVETHHRIDLLMTKAEQGPQAVAKYLAGLDTVRRDSLQSLEELRRDAAAINREIAAAWGRAIVFAASVKLGATVLMKVGGQIPGPPGRVALLYDVAIGAIDDLGKARDAQGIIMMAGGRAVEDAAKDKIGDAAKAIVDRINGEPTAKELKHAFTRMRQLENKLIRQTDRLNAGLSRIHVGNRSAAVRDSVKSLSAQVPRNAASLDQAQRHVAKSAAKFGLARAVSWVFLSRDILDAVATYNATVSTARQ